MKYKITLNDKVYEVEVEQGNAILLDEYTAMAPAAAAAPAAPAAPAAAPAAETAPAAAAPAAAPAGTGELIESPLPGSVFKIVVSPGQAVKKGDTLLIIEAMKMENELSAPRDGVVSSIVTSVGAMISTGDPLLYLN